MPRPKTKQELLDLSEENYIKLLLLIDSYSKEEQEREFPLGTLNRNIKDCVMHLHHWHLLLLDWYKVGMCGQKPEMPAKGYTWKTTPELNKSIWNKHKNVELKKALPLFSESHKQVTKLILKHSNEELFTKKLYQWTGSTSLGAYLISSTCSHYDWAFKLIKKQKG